MRMLQMDEQDADKEGQRVERILEISRCRIAEQMHRHDHGQTAARRRHIIKDDRVDRVDAIIGERGQQFGSVMNLVELPHPADAVAEAVVQPIGELIRHEEHGGHHQRGDPRRYREQGSRSEPFVEDDRKLRSIPSPGPDRPAEGARKEEGVENEPGNIGAARRAGDDPPRQQRPQQHPRTHGPGPAARHGETQRQSESEQHAHHRERR